MNNENLIKAMREALAEQPAQQEPTDKNCSPCPEFWDWLPKAYNFEGLDNFTKYNMEVAFLAGKQNTSPPAHQVPLTDEPNQKLMSAASLALEVLKKHRQMKGEYPVGMLGVRAVEEIETAFREIYEADNSIK